MTGILKIQENKAQSSPSFCFTLKIIRGRYLDLKASTFNWAKTIAIGLLDHDELQSYWRNK